MNLVKLDAIDSTNDFLKEWARKESLANFTVVTAESQTMGKGQMGSVWQSKEGKNLIMSILIKNFIADATKIFDLNIIVSLSVIKAIENFKIPNLSIKWPNDIMSDDKKIAGILIENSFKSDESISSVVGIGLNVNQTHFEFLPNASSLSVIMNHNFDKEMLLITIVESIKITINNWKKNQSDLREKYTNLLFKKGIRMPFKLQNESVFEGVITGVNAFGRLEIISAAGQQFHFEIKEIQMLY